MFASQLLRILQTIPSDVKYEISVPDPADGKMPMKGNNDTTLYDSKRCGREGDLLAFGTKEIYQHSDPTPDINGLVFEIEGRDEHWNPFMDDFPLDDENEIEDSPGKEDQNEKDSNSFFSNVNTKDKVQIYPQHGNESRDLFGTHTNFYTDKNVLKCKPPEVFVRYKEINYHIVKDICVDEGVCVKDEILVESSENDKSNDDSHCVATEGGVGTEHFISDGLAASSLDYTERIIANDSDYPESPPESSFDRDTAKRCGPADSKQTGETNSIAACKTLADVSEEESFVDRKLLFQDFGTRSFLRSFLQSLDGEESETKQLPMQIPENPDTSSAEAGQKEDVQTNSLYYNSEVESGTITFNFNSTQPIVAGVTYSKTENDKEQSVDSRDLLDHRDADAKTLLDTKQPSQDSSEHKSIENVHEQSLTISNTSHENVNDKSTDHEDENSDDLSSEGQGRNSSSSDCQTVEPHFCKHEIMNSGLSKSTDLKDENSDDLSCEGLGRNSTSSEGPTVEPHVCKHEITNCGVYKPTDHEDENSDLASEGLGRNSTSSNGPTVESHVCKRDVMNPGDDSVASSVKYDEGESSFSAAGLITYSGPIAYSGSLSVRSDGSAASGRSFAFPILQSEWNSSPVRMAKADRSHFRKHKGWRSGILCCRF